MLSKVEYGFCPEDCQSRSWFYPNDNTWLLTGRRVLGGFLAGFIGLLVHSIGANTFIIVRIMEPFWFVLGMVVMIPELESKALVDEIS